ncbi:MAG: class I SAM-dependent methyltransferase [Vicinamibacterales bacterium]
MTGPAPAGPPQFGNLEANLRFIDATGALRDGVRVLEIGTGTGSLLSRLRARGYDACGVDVNAQLLDEARRWHGDLPVQQVQGTRLPFADGTFDIVMSFDVFEHIPDTDAHLREVRRVLRPGGRYLIQTPNKWTNVVFETIRWRSFTRFREDHCSLHSLAELRRRLARHGFRTTPYDVPVVNDFFRGKVRTYLGWPGTALLAVVSPDRLPLAWRTNLYVEATLGEPPAGRA